MLESLFDAFCKYMDDKLKWSDSPSGEWTNRVFEFFNSIKTEQYDEQRDYMLVD